MHAYSPQKMHMHSCMRAYAAAQQLLCHGSYCEFIVSLARTSCGLSLADPLLPAIRHPTWCHLDVTSLFNVDTVVVARELVNILCANADSQWNPLIDVAFFSC